MTSGHYQRARAARRSLRTQVSPSRTHRRKYKSYLNKHTRCQYYFTTEFVSVAKDVFASTTNMSLRHSVSLVQKLLKQTDATEVSRTTLNNMRRSKQLWKDFTDVKRLILIIDNLRRTSIDYRGE
ncbi:hypothetical protein SARC_07697, partial [Sphaeroforma arctica JP610]